MAVLKNRAKMSTSSTGTGTITLGSAETGYQSFADAGVANSDQVRYVIEDGNDWEIGTGTYTSSGTTLSRIVSESSNSDSALNLSGSATVFITAAAEDLPNLYADNPVSAVAPTASGNNAVAIGEESTASGTDSISLGSDSDATQTESSALGKFAQATGSGSVSLGARSVASGSNSVALGGYTDATSTNSIAIGYPAQAVTGSGATAIGNSYASGADSFAAVITNNTSSYGATGQGATVIGNTSKGTGERTVSIGQGNIASGANATAIGYLNTSGTTSYSTAIGYNNTASAAWAMALGNDSTASHSKSVSIGDSVTSTAANQVNLGGSTQAVRISESYTLPSSDGSANQVLTAAGDGSTSWAAASGGGGGGADLYAANESSPSAQPSATGANAVAIGDSAISSGEDAISLGVSRATGNHSFAAAIAGNASHIGARGNYSIAMGYEADTGTSSQGAVAIGFEASAGANYAVALGRSSATGADSVALGIANGSSSYGATSGNSIAIGKHAKSTDTGSVSIGSWSQAIASYAHAFGQGAKAWGVRSLALGYNAKANAADAVSIGYDIDNATANQVVLGGSTQQVKISDTYTLPSSDGSANQVLQTDGSGALSFATVSGGGGDPDLYRDNAVSATTPSATGDNAIAMGTGAEASATDGIAIGKDADATGSFRSIGIGRLAQAQGISSIALGYSTLSTSTNGNALGNSAQVAIGTGATAIGNSYASGTEAVAAGIANNGSSYGSSATSSVSLGKLAKATGGYATAIGESTQAQGNNSVCLGYYSQSQGQGTMVMGYDAQSTAVHCTSIGTNTRNAIDGTFKFSGGKHSAAGDAQVGIYPVLCETTDATATTFVTYHSNTITPQTDNQIVLPNNSAYAFSGTIVARQKASEGTACAAWKIEGLIRREGSAGTTVLVNSAKTVLDNTPSWDVTLSADTTNGCLKIQGTGAASTNIRWSSTITTSELTYA